MPYTDEKFKKLFFFLGILKVSIAQRIRKYGLVSSHSCDFLLCDIGQVT